MRDMTDSPDRPPIAMPQPTPLDASATELAPRLEPSPAAIKESQGYRRDVTGPSSRAAGLALAALVLLLFATPLRGVWSRDGGPWWLPFAVWLPAVLGLVWLMRAPREP
jgi:hypothetical protein